MKQGQEIVELCSHQWALGNLSLRIFLLDQVGYLAVK